jgi:hypothetical protein
MTDDVALRELQLPDFYTSEIHFVAMILDQNSTLFCHTEV